MFKEDVVRIFVLSKFVVRLDDCKRLTWMLFVLTELACRLNICAFAATRFCELRLTVLIVCATRLLA